MREGQVECRRVLQVVGSYWGNCHSLFNTVNVNERVSVCVCVRARARA